MLSSLEPSASRPATAGPTNASLERLRALLAACPQGDAVVVDLARIPLLARRPRLLRAAIHELELRARRLGLPLAGCGEAAAVVVCPPGRLGEIEDLLGGLALIFGAGCGPLLAPAAGDGAALGVIYATAHAADREALAVRVAHGAVAAAPPAPLRPPAPRDLARIGEALAEAPIEGLIRRQQALVLAPAARPQPLLCETFVSIAALSALIAPGVDVAAEPALFRFLTRILDGRVLRALAAAPPPTAAPLSLNLGIASLASAELAALERAWPSGQRPIVEIQLAEIAAAPEAFVAARDDLHRRGYGVLIDAVGAEALALIALPRLQPDLVKLFWVERGGAAPPAADGLRARIAALGAERVVLARTESEDAVRWGLALGITRFQGFFVDRLARALAARPAD